MLTHPGAMLMHVDMVYRYPTWAVSFLVVGLSVAAAVVVELIARRVIPLEMRRQNNDVAAAIFSVIGVTFAVLLAFVAMLTFEGYSSAKVAATSEAMVAQDVADDASGLAEPARSWLRQGLASYLDDVVEREWPAQARGHLDQSGRAALHRLDAIASAYRPLGPSDTDDHAALLSALTRLQDARAIRQLAAGSSVPGIVWVIVLLGGGMTVASASFLAAPSARMHMAMSATLAASGALVVVMVIVLSQPFRGDIRVSAAPFENVREGLRGDGPSGQTF